MPTFHHPEDMRLAFLDDHFYNSGLVQNDQPVYYPSVTTVLGVYPKGYGFTEWLKSVGYNADQVVQRAADTGSKIHGAIEQFLLGFPLTWADDSGNAKFTLEEWIMITRFMEFFETHKPTDLVTEFKIINHNYQLGGTIDLMCNLNGKRWLLDFKSSNYLWKEHELQIAAYATMVNENIDNGSLSMPKIERTGILHLKADTRGVDKKGKSMQGKGWRVADDTDYWGRPFGDAFKIFLHANALWREENPECKPKNLIYPDRFMRNGDGVDSSFTLIPVPGHPLPMVERHEMAANETMDDLPF